VIELRIYEVAPGRFERLKQRFAELALPLFDRHGIKVEGPWWFEDEGRTRIVYLMEWNATTEKDERLAAFRSDPEWVEGLAASEKDGPLTERIQVHLLEPLLLNTENLKAP
jgi:hypothetical protein